MKTFIRTDQFNYIKRQTQNLVNGHAAANDEDVIKTLKALVDERVSALFPDMNEGQAELLREIVMADDKEKAEQFLAQLKPYVIPFKVTEQGIKKLFPKVKKLKVPSLEDLDFHEVSYLSWLDNSTNKKYIVTSRNNKLIGVQGSFEQASKKGICALCNGHEDVGVFLAKEKGKEQGTFTKRGNYICQDSRICNNNLTSLKKLYDFVDKLNGRQ